MSEDVDAKRLGQMAGLVAVLSAIIKSLPASSRKRLPDLMNANFEPLIAVMLGATGADADPARDGAEEIRDVFLDMLKRE